MNPYIISTQIGSVKYPQKVFMYINSQSNLQGDPNLTLKLCDAVSQMYIDTFLNLFNHVPCVCTEFRASPGKQSAAI